jgi:hypothetical protein
MTLRIRNSLAGKEAKFRRYIEDERVGKDDVLVVALNVHAIPWAWADMGDLMMRALYGVGDLVLTLNRESGTIVGSHHEQLASINKKSSGQPVEIQPFIDGSMGHVSAVLGSRADAANLPGRLGDDLVLYPNLTAIAPWPEGSIQLGDEWTFATSADGWDGRRAQYIV